MPIIRTKTKDEFRRVVQECLNRGAHWRGDEIGIQEKFWDKGGDQTCVDYEQGVLCFGSKRFFQTEPPYSGHPIISAEEFLGESQITNAYDSVYPLFTTGDYLYENGGIIKTSYHNNLTPFGEQNKPKGKIMSVIKNIFKSEERKALEEFNITNGDGGLTGTGREELLDYLWATNKELRKEFTEKIVAEYKKINK
jgi:hypothetical protein